MSAGAADGATERLAVEGAPRLQRAGATSGRRSTPVETAKGAAATAVRAAASTEAPAAKHAPAAKPQASAKHAPAASKRAPTSGTHAEAKKHVEAKKEAAKHAPATKPQASAKHAPAAPKRAPTSGTHAEAKKEAAKRAPGTKHALGTKHAPATKEAVKKTAEVGAASKGAPAAARKAAQTGGVKTKTTAPHVPSREATKRPTIPKAAQAAGNSGAAPARAAPARSPETQAGAPPVGLLSRRGQPVERRTEGYTEERFLAHQRNALEGERTTYLEQAQSLRAEAESLVQEMEPGDIQFDDESGEGGTITVDRERDLALSAQAMAAVEEIDHALAKMANGTYGLCENCGRLIPKQRLEALPFARLCIDCKSGGLSRR